MRPAQAEKSKKRASDRRPIADDRAVVQGVQMILMFPIVVAVTLLLAIGEIAKAEGRLKRFNVAQ